jgi:NADPH-dependent curcumin reductase CurA
MTTTSREVHLVERPDGPLKPTDFALVTRDLPDPGDGDVLVQNLYMSVDPALRPRMSVGQELNEAIMGGALGRVVKSRNAALPEGAIVQNRMGFREHFLSDGKGLAKLDADPALPLTTYMHVLGNPGLTAYGGLLSVAGLKTGETLWVSTAAGAVGQVAVQIGKIMDCFVIGSTGTEDKVRYLKDELKIDVSLNYKEAPINKQVRAAVPQSGLDVYFDNVGGDHLDAALNVLKHGGRVAVCGMISGYNEAGARTVVRNLSNIIYGGITIAGFSGPEYQHLAGEFREKMTGWLKAGRVKYRETVLNGIENAAAAQIALMEGENIGKMLVKLA